MIIRPSPCTNSGSAAVSTLVVDDLWVYGTYITILIISSLIFKLFDILYYTHFIKQIWSIWNYLKVYFKNLKYEIVSNIFKRILSFIN